MDEESAMEPEPDREESPGDKRPAQEIRGDESEIAESLLERNKESLSQQYQAQAMQTPDQRLFGLIASPDAPIARTFLDLAASQTPALKDRPMEQLGDLVGVMSYALLRHIIIKEAPRLLDWLPDPDPGSIPVLLATPGGYKIAGIPIASDEFSGEANNGPRKWQDEYPEEWSREWPGDKSNGEPGGEPGGDVSG